MRIVLAQINSTVGDLRGNVRKIVDGIQRAREAGADLVAFPELAITGYPPEDLLLKPQFIRDNLSALEAVVRKCRGITAVVGFVDLQDDLYNAAAVIHDGRIALIYHKQYLPHYGVFDEGRYFKPGERAPVFVREGVVIGVNICEDIWHAEGPTTVQAMSGGAQVIVNITASPYHVGKPRLREAMLSLRARENGVIIAYANQVGGQDELVFDGGSLVYDAKGLLLARGPIFEEALMILDIPVPDRPRPKALNRNRRTQKPVYLQSPTLTLDVKKEVKKSALRGRTSPPSDRCDFPIVPPMADRLSRWDEVYRALMLGLSDYVHKNGFKTVTVGLSGGIDSALTAAVAVDALGKEQVVGVFMPSRYTAAASGEDARRLADHLGIRLMTFSIETPFQAHLDLLATAFSALPADTTEENLQSRIRGNIMMALSNKFGWLVLTTGNKSEMSVGYATLYGDMAGGFSVLKDIWKTEVFRLARWRNKRGGPIPVRTLRRAPTAELRPHQTDQDTLPSYSILDPILQAYVEEDQCFDEIVAAGFEPATVLAVTALVDRSEFKRKQAPIGIKVTPRALGKDRRMPVTHRYRTGEER